MLASGREEHKRVKNRREKILFVVTDDLSPDKKACILCMQVPVWKVCFRYAKGFPRISLQAIDS